MEGSGDSFVDTDGIYKGSQKSQIANLNLFELGRTDVSQLKQGKYLPNLTIILHKVLLHSVYIMYKFDILGDYLEYYSKLPLNEPWNT